MDLKSTILEIAAELGFQRTVIAGLQPLDHEQLRYQEWLRNDYAAGMEYLKRNPQFRTTPQLLYPGATSAIVVSVSYYSTPPDSPGPQFGKVANYAVGLDYHAVLRARLRELKSRIEATIGKPLLGKAYTDDVALHEQGFANHYGLGFAGKNTLIIGPKLLGSFNFIAELLTDLELDADEKYHGTCGSCFRCGVACPTNAIVEARTVDARVCISYLTIENKGGIPVELRPKLGSWVFGCDICQDVCPYNQRPPQTNWPEFQPQSGAGHHLDLFGLLEIKSEEEFRARFLTSPIRRPKRRGLLRNALVVIGNQKPDSGDEKISTFIKSEEDPMLLEHANWALAQYS
jgi:epoxyqueuosine reductase